MFPAYVCHAALCDCCANMAEWIELLLRVETLGNLKNNVLDRSPNFHHQFDAAFAKLLSAFVDYVTVKI